MEIKILFKKQRELDHFIEKSKQITWDVFSEKCLGLLVELSELANEVRSFKYWSLKKPSEKDVILDEFVDVLHFLLSIGIEKNLDYLTDWPEKSTEIELTQIFLEINKSINNFICNSNEESYIVIWEWMDALKRKLELTNIDIENAYMRKNRKNFIRQQNGY